MDEFADNTEAADAGYGADEGGFDESGDEAVYDATGSEQRWGDVAEANATAEAYEKALTGGGPRDSYGFPVESDEDEGEF